MTTEETGAENIQRWFEEAFEEGHTAPPAPIERIVRWGMHDDEVRDVYSGAAVALLVDGRFAAIEGDHDYTGWSCQAGTSVTVHATAEEAWLNVTADGRAMIERQETAS